MDTVTHGMMGAILASPFLESQPLAAGAFAIGSAIPDLDVLSRVFGKSAFLRSHQTWSHSLPVIALLAAAAGGVLALVDPGAPALGVAVALGAGMALHVLLDVTNTYGIALWAPFSMRRRCTEWIFFVDAFVVVVSAATLTAIVLGLLSGRQDAGLLAGTWAAIMVLWWTFRAWMRQRAHRACPKGTVALIPSAWSPRRFYGTAPVEGGVLTFTVDGWRRVRMDEEVVPVHDDAWLGILQAVPEFQTMRGLSPAFHVVQARVMEDGTQLTCEDLRIRNFGTTFGRLDLWVGDQGEILRTTFHV